MKNLRYCSSFWFILSICPSVCRWYDVDSFVSIPSILFNSFVISVVKCGPLSTQYSPVTHATSTCYIICKSTRLDYITVVKSSPKHISPPSTVATFLVTCLMAVLQPSGYSVFQGKDTPIQLGLP